MPKAAKATTEERLEVEIQPSSDFLFREADKSAYSGRFASYLRAMGLEAVNLGAANLSAANPHAAALGTATLGTPPIGTYFNYLKRTIPEHQTSTNLRYWSAWDLDDDDRLSTFQASLDELTSLVRELVQLAVASAEVAAAHDSEPEDDWSLTGSQMLFMMQHNNFIQSAMDANDADAILELEASDEFTSVFGEMEFDEAYDRYITMLEEGRA